MLLYNFGRGQERIGRKIGEYLRAECVDAWGTAKFELQPNMPNTRLTVEITFESSFFGRVSMVLRYECWSYTTDPEQEIHAATRKMENAMPELSIPESKTGNHLGMSI